MEPAAGRLRGALIDNRASGGAAVSGRLAWAASAALMAAPVGLYFWFVDVFGVNVPFDDTWNGTLPLLRALADGRLQLAALWAQHNENRMLIPNLLTLLIDSATRMNERADMLVSGCLLVLALVVILVLARRTLRLGPLLLVPVAFLVMGLVQWENILWAFQLAWTLVLLLGVASLAAIEWGRDRWSGWALAVTFGVLASYSSLQGLLVWPVGLYYGWAVGWPRGRAASWTAVGLLTTFEYLRDFGPVGTPSRPLLPFQEPTVAARYAALLVGGMFGFHHLLLGGATIAAVVGLALFVVSDRRWRRELRLPVALISFAVGFDALVLVGRLPLGLVSAGASRYTTYNLCLLVGLWLASLHLVRRRVAPQGSPPSSSAPMLWLGAALVAVIVGCQLGGDVPAGLSGGARARAQRVAGAHLLLDLARAPDSALAADLFFPSGQYVRVWTGVLRRHRWSLFSGTP